MAFPDHSHDAAFQLAERTQKLALLRRMLRHSTLDECPAPTADQSCLSQLIGGPPRPRRLLDLIEGTAGSGAGLLGLWLCQKACRDRGELVVIDSRGGFLPTTAIAWGVDARRLLVVTPERPRDALAVTELALRSPAVGAVWARLGAIEGRAYRRLLFAAEAGEAYGVLVRPARHVEDPSWAHAQIRVDPLAGSEHADGPLKVRATQVRNRHGPAGGATTLAMDWRNGRIDETNNSDDQPSPLSESDALRLASRLADPAAPASVSRAAS